MTIVRLIIMSFVLLFASQVHAQNSVTRTVPEINDLIAQEGKKPPVWWNTVKLEYPDTLDLSLTKPGPNDGWNNQKIVGQYVWDIINPNPGRWKSGIRLFHHLLQMHKDDVAKRNEIMRDLGSMYFRFEQDYARAAFWWEKASGVENFPGMSAFHAECYWRLGNKQMALEKLKNQRISLPQIKLLADMGETDSALKFCTNLSKSEPLIANFYAGDACRVAGRSKEALAYYQKAVNASNNQERYESFRKRAEGNIAGIKVFELLDLTKIADGKYKSESMGYEAPIHVEVVVKSGRIEELKVVEHHEKQFYSSINDTCRSIKDKQGVKGVDATSGATMTSEAIINATAKALATAMK